LEGFCIDLPDVRGRLGPYTAHCVCLRGCLARYTARQVCLRGRQGCCTRRLAACTARLECCCVHLAPKTGRLARRCHNFQNYSELLSRLPSCRPSPYGARRIVMNAVQTRRYEMVVRVRDFGDAHADLLPESSLGRQTFST